MSRFECLTLLQLLLVGGHLSLVEGWVGRPQAPLSGRTTTTTTNTPTPSATGSAAAAAAAATTTTLLPSLRTTSVPAGRATTPSSAATTVASTQLRMSATSNNMNGANGNLEDDDHDHEDDDEMSAGARKRIRLAKAQAEIDRILNHPTDPPFDFDAMMERVVSISHPEAHLVSSADAEAAATTTPPTTTSASTAEAEATSLTDDEESTTNPTAAEQQKVSEAVTADGSNTTNTIISSDAELEEQVSQMEADLYGAVKAQDFAKAAQKQSELSQLHIDDCGLVLQVNSAFYKAFSDKDVEEMERIWLKDRSCVCIHPSFTVLTGIRDIMHTWKRMFESSSGSFQKTWMEPDKIQLTVRATTAVVTCEELVYAKRFVRGQKREVELVNKLTATNLFRKVGGKWYMTHHHSSWHADSHAAKMALQQKGPGKKNRSSRGKTSSSSPNSDPTGMESILGTSDFGPVLGDDADPPSSDRPSNIVLGSLGDLLGNWKSGNSLGGDNMNDSNGEAFIHFEGVHIDDSDGDDEDDDVDENEDEPGWNSAYDRIDRQFRRHPGRRRGRVQAADLTSFSEASPRKANHAGQQECIQALRKLASQGRISQKQKRVLLTDIISCSSQEKKSMVETAFKLLCSGGSTKSPDDDAEEDFADQCLVLSDSLLSDPSSQQL